MPIRPGFIKRHGSRCYFCGRLVQMPPKGGGDSYPNTATADHLTPISRGGNPRRSSGNVVLACYGCNNAKEDRTLQELLKDGWRYGQPVPKKKKTILMRFNHKAKKPSEGRIEYVTFRRHWSMLALHLNNHIDILV